MYQLKMVASACGIREDSRMPTVSTANGKTSLIAHLLQFPEDLRDIRRLVAGSGLSASDVSEILDACRRIGNIEVDSDT